jgi:hypothetical protein
VDADTGAVMEPSMKLEVLTPMVNIAHYSKFKSLIPNAIFQDRRHIQKSPLPSGRKNLIHRIEPMVRIGSRK